MPKPARKPCLRCGAAKAPRNTRYCLGCAAVVKVERATTAQSNRAKAPCARCGIAEKRKGSTLYCEPCAELVAAGKPALARERRIRYYWANRDRVLAAEKGYRSRPETLAIYTARQRKWRKANPERVKRNIAAWNAANPERLATYPQTRRARKLDGFIEEVRSLVVLERDDGVCGICGGDVDPFNFHVDHIIPLSLGGEHSYANVQTAHPLCNQTKGNRMPEEAYA